MHKLTPEWQNGWINGLGGKFEPGEDGYQCIAREIQEEASLVTQPSDWRKVGIMHGPEWQIEVLMYIHRGALSEAEAAEAQPIEWFAVDNLPVKMMSNLNWIIPFCVDVVTSPGLKEFSVTYTSNDS